jgi:LCP family protein required for cell wall assembly
VGFSLLIMVSVLTLLVRDSRTLLKLAFDSDVLIVLLIVNAALFAFRTLAAVDAYRLAADSAVSRPVLWIGGLGLVGLLLIPHGVFAYYDAVQYDLINSVFSAPATTFPTTTSPAPATTTVAPSPGSPVSSTVAPATTTTTTVPPTTEPPDPWGDVGRLNILLLGSDAGLGRTGVRTDTMILASVDVENGDLALISVPRNFARVPVPDDIGIWSCDCFPPILNELYQYAEARPDSFPGPATPGANAIKGAISELTGLPVHFYALVALDGFVDVVDALGGVTITVAERVYDPAYPKEGGGTEIVDLSPGVYDFDGHEALAYARSRHSSDDYDRMGRQRCVIEAVLEQSDPFSLLRNFPQLAEVIKASVETDIPLYLMPDLIDLMGLVDTDQAVSLRLVPPTYVGGWTDDGHHTPDVDLIREHARIVTTLSPVEAMAELGIDPLAQACG